MDSGNGSNRNTGEEEDDASNDYVDDYTITDGGDEALFEAVGHGDEEKPFLTLTEWKNQCEFQCLECGKVFRDASTAQKHVFERHKLDTKTYGEVGCEARKLEIVCGGVVYFVTSYLVAVRML